MEVFPGQFDELGDREPVEQHQRAGGPDVEGQAGIV